MAFPARVCEGNEDDFLPGPTEDLRHLGCAGHTPRPSGYVSWHHWADAMSKTCGKDLDSHDSVAHPEATPEPGDVAICWGCTQVGVFTDSGIRLPSDVEMAELSADRSVQDCLAAIAAAVAAGGDALDAVAIGRHATARRN